QAEDGIRDFHVTGVQTCALPISMAIAGSTRGGPAKAAVLGSAVMGTLSGSSTANVTTTGTFTIPLMKRIGVKPEVAGGIEASARSEERRVGKECSARRPVDHNKV